MTKNGSLCTGYSGLDMAAQAVYGGDLAWVSEIEPGPSKLLAARYPDVPNLGDLTTVDWAKVEPVDVLTAGYPCQPFSHAGQRKGEDDERHLWPHIRNAVSALRPGRVVLENVAGHLSLGGPSVIGDLAVLRYDVRWLVVRASDVGACHRRARLFIVARDAESDAWRFGDRERRTAARDTERPERRQGDERGGRGVEGEHAPRETTSRLGQPSNPPVADAHGDGTTGHRRTVPRAQTQGRDQPDDHDARVRREPAPDASGGGLGARPGLRGSDERGHGRRFADNDDREGVPDADGPRLQGPGQLRGHAAERGRVATDADRGGCEGRQERDSEPQEQEGHHFVGLDTERRVLWGNYEPAIARHAAVLGRPAPPPVDHKKRLAPEFVEWMMMLPAGWVTDPALGFNRTTQLRMLGNGVVPPQAATAIDLLEHAGETVAA